MAIAPQIQQRLPFVDAQGRLTNDGLRALNDALRDIVSAIDSAVAAQQSADTAQDQAIDAATEAANAALAASTAQSTADGAVTGASAALALASTAVQQDAGPSWSAATGTASRATFATYSGQVISAIPTQAEVQAIDDHVKLLSERMKALIDDLQGNGALT